MKKVSIIGLGYVGLPLLCAISKSKKYSVYGYDLSESKIEKISKRICPIDDEVCEKDLKTVDINVSTDPDILKDSDYFIICVPTPVLDDHTPDYVPVIEASKLAAKYLKKGAVVILESTVNPGTCEEVVYPELLENKAKLKMGEFVLSHCPERINPGDPKWNVYNIPRNIGADPSSEGENLADFYRSFLTGEINPVSSLKIAEATKIIENTFRDINIAYVNELARSFDAMGIDLIETIKASSNKPFAFMPHWPGRGVGGHCIAVDPYYLINRAAKSGFDHKFLKMAREVNNGMPQYTVERLQVALNEIERSIKGTKIALLGLSYKENIGDLRESPCLIVKDILLSKGADLRIYDPYIDSMSTVKSLEEALKDSVAVVLCTAHKPFKELGKLLKKYPNVKVVVDGMNKLDKKEIEKLGVIYRGIGR
ncbi:nucleotide sugar dehydrogenase [Patescibacteria group bacterium]|nr:nucleotide sugar dehydrogenase [Patescibacteria group bacterium]